VKQTILAEVNKALIRSLNPLHVCTNVVLNALRVDFLAQWNNGSLWWTLSAQTHDCLLTSQIFTHWDTPTLLLYSIIIFYCFINV